MTDGAGSQPPPVLIGLKPMKILLALSLLILLGLFACATQLVESVTIFSIQGRVLEAQTNFPLEGVSVHFIDGGYDDILSKKPTPITIGRSNSRGKIDLRFNYLWGRKKSVFDHRPKATFDIVLSRESYATQRFHFKESELPTDGVTLLVNLKDVYLVRKNE